MGRLPWLVILLAGFSGAAVAGEESSPSSEQTAVSSPPPSTDPYELLNRRMFGFNAWLVGNVVDPVASWLVDNTHEQLQQAGHNIYENLIEPEFIVSNLFAGNYSAAGVSAKRFAINTTLGMLGSWDAAQWLGYQRKEVGFVESLCMAGMPAGNYVVLPAVGPASGNTALLVTGFFSIEWYLLAMLSSTVATADLVVDVSASAASLREMRDIPVGSPEVDPYLVQRDGYLGYLKTACGPK